MVHVTAGMPLNAFEKVYEVVLPEATVGLVKATCPDWMSVLLVFDMGTG
jgi:hypothetical protein